MGFGGVCQDFLDDPLPTIIPTRMRYNNLAPQSVQTSVAQKNEIHSTLPPKTALICMSNHLKPYSAHFA